MKRKVFMSLLVLFVLSFCITVYAREPITDINLDIAHTQNEITINDIYVQANTPHYTCEKKEFQPVTKDITLYLRAADGFVFQTRNASQVVLNGAQYVTATKMEKSSLLVLTIELTDEVIWLEDRDGWEDVEDAIKYKYEDGHYASEGWNQIGDKYYYFDENGNLLISTRTPDGYKVNSQGEWDNKSPVILME